MAVPNNSRSSTSLRVRLLADTERLAAYLRARLAVDTPAATSPGVPTSPFQHPLPPREAAVLAPLYSRDGRPHLIFTVRSLDLASHRGEISFPGGSRDPGDETIGTTALREAREELGLDPARIELLGSLPLVFAGPSNFVVTPFVGWLGEGLPELTPSPAEVAEVIDAPLAALADPAIYHTEIWQRFGQPHLLHFYDFGPYRIWGATGRMLRSLLDLLPPDQEEHQRDHTS
ncbi:MAG TPA: CoA pyrophosphatase [Ktedonobacterales bacterium]|nr:CoA pyrophosphatase [Ktedonobacterales bacterium]